MLVTPCRQNHGIQFVRLLTNRAPQCSCSYSHHTVKSNVGTATLLMKNAKRLGQGDNNFASVFLQLIYGHILFNMQSQRGNLCTMVNKQINCEIISTVLSAKLWSMQSPLHYKEVFQNLILILCSVSSTILFMVERFKTTKSLFFLPQHKRQGNF